MNPEWMLNPEAHVEDYAELQQLFADFAGENILEGDLCDIVRAHDEEENLTDEERDEVNARREGEWMEFYRKGGEFPYEM